MYLKRDNFKSIKKKTILLNNLVKFSDLDINLLNRLLNEVITEYTYNTFDLMSLLKTNYDGNLKTSINKIKDYSSVRFNCYYACKKLIEKLNKINIKSYLISYKSIGFSSVLGDDLIKEAHMSLVIPTINDGKVYYILMDPGLRIPECMCFYRDEDEKILEIDNDIITIKKNDDKVYNYTMIMEGFNRYSNDSTSYKCQEYFDLDHELINPEELLFPTSYYVLLGYRAIKFSEDKQKRASIKLMVVDEYIEISNVHEYKKVSFKELNMLTDAELRRLIKNTTSILNIDDYEFMLLIRFILMVKDDIKDTVLDSIL